MSEVNQVDARARRMRSLDIIKVHNTTSEDFVMWHDRFGSESRKVMIPKAQKDIGKGKGNNDVPRYIAEIFTKKLIEQEINKEANEQLVAIRKRDRRLARPERLQNEETEVIRTNDVKFWNDMFPKVWLGVVEKYGGDLIDDPSVEVPVNSGNRIKDMAENSGLADKPYVESKKQDI